MRRRARGFRGDTLERLYALRWENRLSFYFPPRYTTINQKASHAISYPFFWERIALRFFLLQSYGVRLVSRGASLLQKDEHTQGSYHKIFCLPSWTRPAWPMDVHNAEQSWEGDKTLHNRKACNQTSNRTSKVESYSFNRSMDECILH